MPRNYRSPNNIEIGGKGWWKERLPTRRNYFLFVLAMYFAGKTFAQWNARILKETFRKATKLKYFTLRCHVRYLEQGRL